jgi:multiple sugar transport system substrate-binding protein
MDLLFYNIEILKAAGFDRPPKNREEFLNCARAIGSLGKQHSGAAMALGPADPRGIRRDVFSWIRAAGAAMPADGGPDFQDRRIVDTLDFLNRLNRESLLAPGTFDASGKQRLEEFAARRIGMMIGSIKDIGILRQKMDEGVFGVTLVPGPADYPGKPVLGLSTCYAGIGALCKYPDEAWAFLSFLRENSALLASRTGAIPDSYVPEDPLYAKIWDIYEGAELVSEFPGLPRMAELEAAVREELALMFRGAAGPAETAAAIQKRRDSPE